MTTKLSNPHYSPEVSGKTQIINYGLTQQGLEAQLLMLAVRHERPDLEEAREGLVAAMGANKALLKGLEDTLLRELSNASGARPGACWGLAWGLLPGGGCLATGPGLLYWRQGCSDGRWPRGPPDSSALLPVACSAPATRRQSPACPHTANTCPTPPPPQATSWTTPS